MTIPLSLFSEELTNKELNEKIKQAQAYFDDREYDKAIQILTEVVESNPERLDQAVDLMDKITEIRNQYNEKYKELIEALYVDEDPERALELIAEMEAIEKNPNEVAKKMIRDARISAELVYNKIRLREIMDEAKIELDLKDYADALVLYESGFELGLQTYEESEIVSEIEKNSVQRAISDIQDSAVAYLENGQNLVNQINSIRNRISATASDGLIDEFNTLVNLMNQFSQERNTYFEKSKIVDDSLEIIVAFDKNAPERFFLDFSKFLIYGRNDVDYYEGIISTTDLFWEDQFQSLAAIVDKALIDSYNSAVIEYKRGNFDVSESLFDDTLNYAKNAILVYEALDNRLSINIDFSLDEYSSDLIQNYYGKLVDGRILARVTDSYNKMIALRRGFSDYDLTGEQSLEDLYELRVQIVKDLPIIDEEELLWDTIGGSINWLEDYNAQPETADGVYNLVRSDMSALKNEMKDINLAILTRLTDREYARITNALSDFNDEFEENQLIIDGIIDSEIVAYTGDDQIKSTFPQRALPNLVSLLEDLKLLTEDTQEIIDTFEQSGIEITEGSTIDEFLIKTKLVLPQISELVSSTDELEILARDNIFKAEGLENQGNKLIDNVRQIVNSSRADRNSFDRARENLKDASSAYFQSFSYMENLDLRKRADEDIAGLQQGLLDAENRLVVADVRNFINQGKEAYVNRQYGRSRVYLERAQNRWLTTNSDDHPEIQYWMALVDLALQFDRGRTISKTEPLYDEMTQFLNLAYSNYNRGVNLISSGERTEGLQALDGALETLENVTIFMPKNESASLLRLKIAQLIDPDEFRESFSIRIDEAWEKLQSDNKSTQGEGYIELIDLSKIDTNYPGLQNKISIAEFDILKTRQRPPNPKDLADSSALYTRAETIVEGNIRSQFEIALTYLDQAIELNPNNTDAISLKDKIQVDTGGQATFVLPTALENRFREALEQFEQGNNLNAFQIIQDLKKDPRSASYPPLLKLEERVRLKLQN